MARLPVTLLMLACVGTATFDVWNMYQQPYGPPEDHDALEQLFEGLKRELPNVPIVGFAHEPNPNGGGLDRDGALYFTQYVLAPVLVADDFEQEYVVGLFFSPQAYQRFRLRSDLIPIRDYRNGVVLFKNGSDR